MEEKINEYIKYALDLKSNVAAINRGISIFDDKEDGFILSVIRGLPSNEEIDTFIFYLKEKLNRINETKLYCIETDSTTEKGYTVVEVKVLKDTGKLFKISAYGLSQVNKYSDLYVDKGDESTIRIFATDIEKGVTVIKKSIEKRVQDIRLQLEEYNNTLEKVKSSKDIE